MQLACVLHMVPGWKNATKVRVFMCIDNKTKDAALLRRQWDQMLHMLRIDAIIQIVLWDHITSPLDRSLTDLSTAVPSPEDSGNASQFENHSPVTMFHESPQRVVVSHQFLRGVNVMIQEHSHNTAVVFLYLPPPPANINDNVSYLEKLDILTSNLPPTLLVHGINPVTSITL